MNLYVLVEGRRTEKQVYREWIRHLYPSLTHVQSLEELQSDNYLIITGGGQPRCFEFIRHGLEDIRDHGYPIDHFMICFDSEEQSYEETLAAIRTVVESSERELKVRAANPSFSTHIIVQHCCIETWFLGHPTMLRKNPQSERLRVMKEFYDIRENDPEAMGRPNAELTRSAFHGEYLEEMFREQGLSYTKKRPGEVLMRHYLDALRERCTSTGHLQSLQRLFAALDGLGPSL